MLIRPVTEEDVESLRDNCFSTTTVDQTRSNVQAALVLMSAGEGTSLVAVDERGQVVGNLTVTRKTHRLERHRAEIGGFVITPRAQGSGLARTLVDAAAEWATDHGCTMLEISCRGRTRAEDAYIGLGFQEWGRLPGGYREPAGVFEQVNLFKELGEAREA